MRISTKKGDKGESSLSTQKRMKKSAPLFQALGDLDELNSFLGWTKFFAKSPKNKFLIKILERAQDDVYRLMSVMANEMKVPKNIKTIDEKDVKYLEGNIEKLEKKMGVLRKFVKPGRNELSARLHLSRVVCRRAERSVVDVEDLKIPDTVLQYMNRLSDLLFLLAESCGKK